MARRFLLLALLAALSLTLGLVTFTPYRAVMLVQWSGYWVVLIGFGWFAWHFIRSLRGDWARLRDPRAWWKEGLLVLAAAAFFHVSEPHGFKIVADEVVLSSTAMDMHFNRSAAVLLRGYEYAGNFTTFVDYVDKRPLFFPFLLTTVHDLTGYRVGNALALNAALSLALSALAFLVGRRIGGFQAGAATVLLFCSIPLMAQNATGGGFELLNLVMILLTVWLGLRWAESPDTDRLCAFVLAGVLLAQTRYESAFFIVPVAGAIVYGWWRRRQVELPWALVLAPALLILLPLQFNVFRLANAAWQLGDIEGATAPFGLSYFYDNVGHAMNFFLSLDGTQGNSVLVAVLGVFGVGFFVLTLYKHHREIFAGQPETAVLCVFLIGMIAHTALMLCYFWGHWDEPIIRRLSLPSHVLLILAFVMVLPRLTGSRRSWMVLNLVTLGFILSVTIPVSAMHRYTQDNFAARATNWIAGYIRAAADKPTLAIDNNNGLEWLLYRKPCITTTALAQRPDAFLYHYRRQTFAEIYVVQRAGLDLTKNERWVSADEDLGTGVKLELIEEKAFAPAYLLRISRVVSVDEEKFLAWAKERKKLVQAKRIISVPGSVTSDELLEWIKQLP